MTTAWIFRKDFLWRNSYCRICKNSTLNRVTRICLNSTRKSRSTLFYLILSQNWFGLKVGWSEFWLTRPSRVRAYFSLNLILMRIMNMVLIWQKQQTLSETDAINYKEKEIRGVFFQFLWRNCVKHPKTKAVKYFLKYNTHSISFTVRIRGNNVDFSIWRIANKNRATWQHGP